MSVLGRLSWIGWELPYINGDGQSLASDHSWFTAMDPMEEDDEETESLCDSPLEADIISTGDQILDTSHTSADMVNGGNGMWKTNGFAAGVGPAMGDSSDTDTCLLYTSDAADE